MNKKTKYVAIGLVLLCLAYPGFAWLIGMQVEASILKREQQVMDQYPGSVTLISRQYHRGVYGATEDLTYGFGAAAMRALVPFTGTSNAAALQMTVRNTIHHGPLPQFRTIGLATFTTQVQLPTQLRAQLRAFLGGEPAIEIHSRLGWFGGVETAIASPGYEARLADGTRISWHDLEASSRVSANLSSTSFDGKLAAFEVKSAKAQAQLDGLQLHADLKRAFEGLYTGPFEMKITAVEWQSQPASAPASIQGLSIIGSGAAEGDYYKSAVQFGADTVQAAGFSIAHAGYAMAFEHLHGPTLEAMMKDARATSSSSDAAAQPPAVTLQNMRKNLIELLLHDPILNISHIGFSMPEGALSLSAKASAPGLKREDLDGAQLQAALAQHLNVVADLRIDAAVLTKLATDSGRKDALAAQLDAFEHQGYIKRDGTALTAHVTLTGGKIEVNGQPYPPRPGQ